MSRYTFIGVHRLSFVFTFALLHFPLRRLFHRRQSDKGSLMVRVRLHFQRLSSSSSGFIFRPSIDWDALRSDLVVFGRFHFVDLVRCTFALVSTFALSPRSHAHLFHTCTLEHFHHSACPSGHISLRFTSISVSSCTPFLPAFIYFHAFICVVTDSCSPAFLHSSTDSCSISL